MQLLLPLTSEYSSKKKKKFAGHMDLEFRI
jgi:hypothetical protein